MTGKIMALAGEYIELRRGLGYRSPSQERALRAFARHLDRDGHDGPIPLELSLDWAASTVSADPCNPARRLAAVRGFLRHLAAADGATEVPAPGLLGPAGHRKPPHVYSDREIDDLLHAAAGLAPPGGLRPHCYATLFGLIACTGLRISEALSLTCGDVDLADGVLTIRVIEPHTMPTHLPRSLRGSSHHGPGIPIGPVVRRAAAGQGAAAGGQRVITGSHHAASWGNRAGHGGGRSSPPSALSPAAGHWCPSRTERLVPSRPGPWAGPGVLRP